MERFWFDFHIGGPTPSGVFDPQPSDEPPAHWLAGGAGVTAWDEHDALALLRERAGGSLPPVSQSSCGAAADRRALSIAAGRPVGDPSWRGVWFPTSA